MSWHEYERLHAEKLEGEKLHAERLEIEKEKEKEMQWQRLINQFELSIGKKVIEEKNDEILLVNKIIDSLRGKTLTRNSINRIKQILCDCTIYEDIRQEEWKRVVMKRICNSNGYYKEEKKIQSDFIEAGEMEI